MCFLYQFVDIISSVALRWNGRKDFYLSVSWEEDKTNYYVK